MYVSAFFFCSMPTNTTIWRKNKINEGKPNELIKNHIIDFQNTKFKLFMQRKWLLQNNRNKIGIPKGKMMLLRCTYLDFKQCLYTRTSQTSELTGAACFFCVSCDFVVVKCDNLKAAVCMYANFCFPYCQPETFSFSSFSLRNARNALFTFVLWWNSTCSSRFTALFLTPFIFISLHVLHLCLYRNVYFEQC